MQFFVSRFALTLAVLVSSVASFPTIGKAESNGSSADPTKSGTIGTAATKAAAVTPIVAIEARAEWVRARAIPETTAARVEQAMDRAVRAANQGYTSVSVPVPRGVLMQAIVEAVFVS